MFEFQVSVPFVPRWQHVELLRTAVLNCLTTMFQAHDFCDQLAMVAAELLENAVHYGKKDADERFGFRLEVRGDEARVTIEVRNPGVTDPHDLDRLKETLAQLSGTDPRAAYIARLKELAARPEVGGSGLGLFRVAFETGCDLHAEVDSDGLVIVRAVVHANRPPPDPEV